MAEGWSNSVLCRYYLNGCCREGAECRFSHDRQGSQPSNVCRYYAKGQCSYGERCRYDHVKTSSPPTNNSPPSAAPVARATPSSVMSTADKSTVVSSGNAKVTPTIANHRTSEVASVVSSTTANNTSNKGPELPVLAATNTMSNASSAPLTGKMTVLKRQQTQSSGSGCGGSETPTSSSSCTTTTASSPDANLSLWVEAPEFVPTVSKPVKSYAQALDPLASIEEKVAGARLDDGPGDVLCPYAIMDECRFGDQCLYVHGDICELCGHACLHPTDQEQRKVHAAECVLAHERDMELSFAVAQSRDKTCSICMDVIMDKWPSHERRFGILPNCVHVFCLSCIRTWRNTKQLENKTIRSCPQCRTPSDYVTPSKYWVESKEDKLKLIEDYKKALSEKPCKYFKQGAGECPFAGNCFYMHAYADGRRATLPPPRPRRRHTADGELETMQQIFLWDFMEERENRWLFHFDLEDMLDFFSDSDDTSSEEFSDSDT